MVIGLGSMLGAGVFAAVGPAAEVAGSALLIGLVLAGAVAFANATSSAALAAVHPASGGTYVYGRVQLGPLWGRVAGWGFVVGKTASCAAMALTFGAYALPGRERPSAIAAVVGITAVNAAGVRKTATVTRVVVGLVVVALVLVVIGASFGGAASASRLDVIGDADGGGVLRSAGLLFFAFAGYARIATLGEEVVDPATTIPRAVPRALGLTLLLYSAVLVSALVAVGPAALAASDAPLATAVQSGDLDVLVPAVRFGGALASLGVLLSLVAGVSRTAFAMAAEGELPRWLDAIHPEHRIPHRAVVAVGVAVVALVAVADVRGAIGFSSFCVLGYYAVTNAAAWTLPAADRRWPRWLSVTGGVGCVVLACTLPLESVVIGAVVLVVGVIATGSRRR